MPLFFWILNIKVSGGEEGGSVERAVPAARVPGRHAENARAFGGRPHARVGTRRHGSRRRLAEPSASEP